MHMSLLSFRTNVRSGISLMEVLISIGVVAIGLSGLAFLLPVAHHQAESGARTDRMASVGKRAFREFHVREMARPERWRIWNNVAYAEPLPAANAGPDASNPFWYRTNNGGLVRKPLCIDPRAYAAVERYTDEVALGFTSVDTRQMAELLRQSGDKEVLLRGAFTTFPAQSDENAYYLTNSATLGTPYFGRITLTSTDLFTIAAPPAGDQTLPPRATNNDPWILSRPQADSIFVLGDDLDLLIPTSNAEGPVQRTLRNAQSAPMRRLSAEGFSWFATLVPLLNADLNAGMDNDLYRLSIVVCFGRDTIAPERFMPVVVQHGMGGGDVQLIPNLNNKDSNGEPYDPKVRVEPNSWVMLANSFTRQFRWYRVLNAEGFTMTLQGEDWKPAVAGQGPADFIYIVPNVVNVYEKTIHLETSSLWTR